MQSVVSSVQSAFMREMEFHLHTLCDRTTDQQLAAPWNYPSLFSFGSMREEEKDIWNYQTAATSTRMKRDLCREAGHRERYFYATNTTKQAHGLQESDPWEEQVVEALFKRELFRRYCFVVHWRYKWAGQRFVRALILEHSDKHFRN